MPDDLQNNDTLEEGLRRAGVFHPDDLQANRAGELSAAQKRWLTFEIAGWLSLAGVEMGIVVASWIFYFQHPFGSLFQISLFWGILLTIFAGMCIQEALPILGELRDGQVEAVSGTLSKHVTVVSSRAGSGAIFSIEIHNRSFGIHATTYDAIIDHQSYRLFYTPRNHTLVNIEPLFISDENRGSALASLQQKTRG